MKLLWYIFIWKRFKQDKRSWGAQKYKGCFHRQWYKSRLNLTVARTLIERKLCSMQYYSYIKWTHISIRVPLRNVYEATYVKEV